MGWRDQVALVTGGARGLGRATAWLLAQRGAAVCVNYAAHGDAAEALIAEIAAAGGRGIAVAANVAEVAAVEAMVGRTETELGPMTILVNNAGVAWQGTLDSYDREQVAPVGALFGLTPKKYQSGEKDVTGGITRAGDEMVRTALYEAANVLLSRITRFSRLKRWGMDVAKRRGSKRAKVALARKIGVILHRMWVDGTTYRWTEVKPIAAQA